jgi:TRAP-type C4-dicarboxylate transport system permease small subunit
LADTPGPVDERRLWVFAFLILLLVSLWIMAMRLLNGAFLSLEMEASLVYLPTVLAGGIAFYLSVKRKPSA